MAAHFILTLHALRRFIERYPAIADLKCGQYRRFLVAELERAVRCGGSVTTGVRYLLPCGLVAVIVWHDGKGFVKTLLTLKPTNWDALGALARQHFDAGLSWKERTAILRRHGFDPAGAAGEIYRAAYQALERAKWAAA